MALLAPNGATLETATLETATLEATALEATALETATLETAALETAALEVLETQDIAEPSGAEEVEAALDEVLAEQMGNLPLTEGEFVENGDALDLRHPTTEFEAGVVRLRQPDEFVCSKCFLVKRRELLADADRTMCRDCAA